MPTYDLVVALNCPRSPSGPNRADRTKIKPATRTMAGPEGVSGKMYDSVNPNQQLSNEKMNPRPSCAVIVPDQYRAAVAGKIISPTAISVPNVLNAANRFSTKRNIKP